MRTRIGDLRIRWNWTVPLVLVQGTEAAPEFDFLKYFNIDFDEKNHYHYSRYRYLYTQKSYISKSSLTPLINTIKNQNRCWKKNE